jgi:mRNA interferase HicA
MKRKKLLLQHLQANGCALLREGGRHTIYWRVGTGLQAAIPRHPEIKATLVRKICKDLNVEAPSEK